jgi:micrococcal nuclease
MMMRPKARIIIVLLLALVSAVGCMRNSGETDSRENGVRIARVIDGDTIELSNRRKVRYIGIDTPEVRQRHGRNWVYAPEPYSLAAKDHNEALLRQGKVTLEFDEQKEDKYGRSLAYVYAGETMVNEELLREGYATLLIYPPNTKYLELLIGAQEDARRHRRGMWNTLKTISPGEAASHIGKLCMVKGKVLRAGRSGEVIFLSFGEKHKNGFTAIIYNNNMSFFEKQGIHSPEDYYNGRHVALTGKIRDRNGPQIVVYHPFQIENQK